jgi:hypothetical protein
MIVTGRAGHSPLAWEGAGAIATIASAPMKVWSMNWSFGNLPIGCISSS